MQLAPVPSPHPLSKLEETTTLMAARSRGKEPPQDQMLEPPAREELTPERLPEEEGRSEVSLRPKQLREYIGQEKVKANLRVFIEAAKARGEALDHCLFSGPPGLGKTTLANIIANELGTNIKSTSGPAIERSGDLVAILTNLEQGDVLFIDEIHRMNRTIEEILYPAMEDYEVDIILGQGPNARSIKLSLPRFTLVGATTREGLLAPPFRARFGIHQVLEFYKPEELRVIVERSSELLGYAMTQDGAFEIARRSRGTPRIANRLLRRVRDFAQVDGRDVIDKKVADAALRMLDVDERGFDKMDRKILLTLIEKFNGGPAGVETLAAAIGEERDTIEDVYEPFLLQNGFINRTRSGRVATLLAYQHFGIKRPPPTGALQESLF